MHVGVRHRRRTPPVDPAPHHKRFLQPGTFSGCSLGSHPESPPGAILYDHSRLLHGVWLPLASASHVRCGGGMGSCFRSRAG